MTFKALEAIRELRQDLSLSTDDCIIITSFELPVKIRKRASASGSRRLTEFDFIVSQSNALLLPGLYELRRAFNCNVKFVGYCGYTTQDEAEREIIRQLLDRMDCRPVFPPVEHFREYVGFCFNYLSPIFHSILHLDSVEPFNQHNWTIFQSMNKLWADEAMFHHSGDSDIVWVHDFQLLLVPQYLSRRYKRANIGLFLHVPFPSCDVFRCIPVRDEIVRGMLCADLVGFHFFEYARHFFIVCKKLLGLDQRFYLGGFLGLEYAGRNVTVKIGHVNVEYERMRKEIRDNPEIIQMAKEIRHTHAGKFLFGALDKCDQLAGLSLKLKAMELFIKQFPYARNNVVLIQYAYPTRCTTLQQDFLSDGACEDTQEGYSFPERNDYSKDLLALARGINQRLNNDKTVDDHIVFNFQVVPREKKWALLLASDCLLDTSIRDGLNLTAFEYIACRGDRASHLILSEFTGCSATLTSAKRINPWCLEDVAAKLDMAVSITNNDIPAEKWARDQHYLSRNSLEKWAKDFLSDLRKARKTGGKVYMQCGFSSTFRVLSMDEDFKPLDVNSVVRSYRKACRRLLFFDHEGTLAPDRRHLICTSNGIDSSLSALGTPPSPRVVESLLKLCEDPSNTVVIFSGRDKNCLEQWFGGIPGLGLCAEHGYYINIPTLTKGKWECLAPTEDFVWKELAFELMSQYVDRTQGSFVENKGSALVFQHRDADPDFGAWQAKQLATYLGEFLFHLPVSVVSGKGYVEARVSGVSKGLTAEYLIHNLGDFHFIICIGDDQSDEEMFSVVNRLGDNFEHGDRELLSRRKSTPVSTRIGIVPREESGISAKSIDMAIAAEIRRSDSEESPPPGEISSNKSHLKLKEITAFSVTVGKKPSQANFYLNDPEEISDLLATLECQVKFIPPMNSVPQEGGGIVLATTNNNKPSCHKFQNNGATKRMIESAIEKSRLDTNLDPIDAWLTTVL